MSDPENSQPHNVIQAVTTSITKPSGTAVLLFGFPKTKTFPKRFAELWEREEQAFSPLVRDWIFRAVLCGIEVAIFDFL